VAATSQKSPVAWCQSVAQSPAPFATWDEYVMSAAGPWSRSWDQDWDGRHPKDPVKGQEFKGKVRHLLLIRHGQYDLDSDDHGLTELGKKQSVVTGQRLASLTAGIKKDHYGEQKITFKSIVSSNVLRAQQTADIIAKELPGVPRSADDPVLAEGYPCLPQPGGSRDSDLERMRPAKIFRDSVQIEAAFRKYFHRDVDHKRKAKKDKDSEAPKEAMHPGQAPLTDAQEKDKAAAAAAAKPALEHEYTIVVCHMNVIRYFVCRALQMPPEFWLRFRGDNCGITEIVVHPSGRCSLSHFADTGHLPIEMHTFH
jgi:serine/threonine-protein phosphatase PGAM5